MIRNKSILELPTRIFLATRLFVLLLLVQSLLSSCNSDSTLIGESLQPLSELMKAKHVDSLTINAYTLSHDSMPTSNSQYALAGTMMDPMFGSSRASFLSRARLDGSDTYPEAFTPGPDAIGDSLVLTLLPKSYYGDPSTKMNMKVYRLTEDILQDSTYYADHDPQFDPATENSKVVSVTDSLIRIVLDSTFYKVLVDGVDTIKLNSELREHFKGIYVTVDSLPVEGEGAIMSLDLLSYQSTLFFYYRKPGDTLIYQYEFLLNISSARANLFSHDHSAGQITHLNDTVTEDTLIYVQGIGGTYVRIDVPYLKELNNMGIRAINKAQISFKSQDYVDTAFYPPPDRLILYKKNDEGIFAELFDLQLGDDYFGGLLDDETGKYTFNITNHVMEFMDGDKSTFSLYLFVKGVTIAPERVTLFNGTAPDNIRFRIIYTEL